MSHDTEPTITTLDNEALANAGPDAAYALNERQRELDERSRELDKRRKDHTESLQGADEREQKLDERRRKLVAQWADVDQGGQSLREQSHALDLRRQDLGSRKDDLTVRERGRANDLADKLLQLDKAHTPALHASIMALREEGVAHEAQETQLFADVAQYNLDYDGFLTELEQQVQLEERWLSEMATWVADRRQHNVDTNQRNAEYQRIKADHRVFVSQRAQLMQDIKTFIGPYEVDESVRRERSPRYLSACDAVTTRTWSGYSLSCSAWTCFAPCLFE